LYLPASFSSLLFVQYLMIFARGRTRSSSWTYVLIIRVFSRARGLLTLMSHANSNSGSQHFTIGTLATALQTTLSMPPAHVVSNQKSISSTIGTQTACQDLLLCKSVASECMLSNFFSDVVTHMSTSESSLLNRLPELPKTETSMSLSGHSSLNIRSSFLINAARRASLSALGNSRS
jgi:hypothetical protein